MCKKCNSLRPVVHILVAIGFLAVAVIFPGFDHHGFLDSDSAEEVLLFQTLSTLLVLTLIASRFPTAHPGAPRLLAFQLIHPPIFHI
jgi:hypothetical protein